MRVRRDGLRPSPGWLPAAQQQALLTTLTELSAMAAPASTGLRKPSAASGMPAAL
jgi:hypothetical protein